MRLSLFPSRQHASRPAPLRLTRRDVRRVRNWIATSPSELEAAADVTRLLINRRAGERSDLSTIGVMTEVRAIGPARLGAPLVGRVRDVSREGLSLLLPEEVVRNERLHVTILPNASITTARDGRPLTVLCTARWCRPDTVAGGWVLGCSVGVDWTDSLADLMLPANVERRVA